MIQAAPEPWQQVFAREQEQRATVVRIAHEWVGTPYQHGARIKRVACDCTFFAMVYEEAKLVPHVPIRPYSSMAHLHRASGQYLQHIRKYAHEVDDQQTKPGDIVMYFIARDFSHGGIIIEPGWPSIIHADMGAGAVVPADGTQGQLARSSRRLFFSLW